MSASSSKAKQKHPVAALVSGGISSLALLNYCSERYSSIYPISIQSGFRWEEAELFTLKKFLRGYKKPGIKPLTVLLLPLRDTFQSHWSVTGVKVPAAKAKFNDTYLPGLDALLLTKALVYCSNHNIPSLAIGHLKDHFANTPIQSCIENVEEMISKSKNKDFKIISPFSKMDRDEVMFQLKSIGFDHSFSCLSPKGYQHCGSCYKCDQRKMGFFKTGILDKTHYYKAASTLSSTSK